MEELFGLSMNVLMGYLAVAFLLSMAAVAFLGSEIGSCSSWAFARYPEGRGRRH